MKYLLPCQQCGERLTVDISQAGRQVVCRCGAAQEVPSLRAIRQLETIADSVARPPKQSWDLTRGVLFAAGLLLAVAGLVTAGLAGISWATAKVPPLEPENVAPALAEVDALRPAGAWDAWVDFRTNGLGPYVPPAKFMVEVVVQRFFRVMVAGLVVLAIGAAMSAASMLLSGTAIRQRGSAA